MATDYVLSFKDGRSIGSFWEVEGMLRDIFPNVRLSWRNSGWETLRIAKERGIEVPPGLRYGLKCLPALYRGVMEAGGCHIEFCLGPKEPVTELAVYYKGDHESLERWLGELESRIGTKLRVHGTPAVD